MALLVTSVFGVTGCGSDDDVADSPGPTKGTCELLHRLEFDILDLDYRSNYLDARDFNEISEFENRLDGVLVGPRPLTYRSDSPLEMERRHDIDSIFGARKLLTRLKYDKHPRDYGGVDLNDRLDIRESLDLLDRCDASFKCRTQTNSEGNPVIDEGYVECFNRLP
jgi:hypothetical protein